MNPAMTAAPPARYRAARPCRTGPPPQDTGNLTLNLALEIRAWHGFAQTQRAGGPLCAHCMPDAHWPCGPFSLAQHVIETLTRDEPYGILADNAYLREIIETEGPGGGWVRR